LKKTSAPAGGKSGLLEIKMNQYLIGIVILLLWTLPGSAAGQAIVVDHTSIGLFERIPENYLEAARNLRVLFMDRSVGVNTHDALNCLTAKDYGSSRVTCRRDYQSVNGVWKMKVHRNSSRVPEYIRFTPSPSRYNRSKWKFHFFFSAWDKMVTDFVRGLHDGAIPVGDYPGNEQILINPMDFDVLSFQFGYLNVMDGSKINEFFTRRPGEYDDVFDLEREVSENLAGADPPRLFVYWTPNMARSIGTGVSAQFNRDMRKWCVENDKILFDFADIQVHDMFGKPCYDNRDGVPYGTPSGNKSENHPDDGLNIPAICQEKTIETEGGHLGTAQGSVSVAKGFWVLMARIAGWNPDAP